MLVEDGSRLGKLRQEFPAPAEVVEDVGVGELEGGSVEGQGGVVADGAVGVVEGGQGFGVSALAGVGFGEGAPGVGGDLGADDGGGSTVQGGGGQFQDEAGGGPSCRDGVVSVGPGFLADDFDDSGGIGAFVVELLGRSGEFGCAGCEVAFHWCHSLYGVTGRGGGLLSIRNLLPVLMAVLARGEAEGGFEAAVEGPLGAECAGQGNLVDGEGRGQEEALGVGELAGAEEVAHGGAEQFGHAPADVRTGQRQVFGKLFGARGGPGAVTGAEIELRRGLDPLPVGFARTRVGLFRDSGRHPRIRGRGGMSPRLISGEAAGAAFPTLIS